MTTIVLITVQTASSALAQTAPGSPDHPWHGPMEREIEANANGVLNNKLPAGAGQDHDFVRSILRNPIEGIDKLGVSLCGHNERSALAVELDYQHAQGISG
jgi:hypothetical protein